MSIGPFLFLGFWTALFSAGSIDRIAAAQEAGGTNLQTTWAPGQTFHLKGYDVSLSAPRLIAESTDYLAIPKIARLADGTLVVSICAHEDAFKYPSPRLQSFSEDGGLTWSRPVANADFLQSQNYFPHLTLPSRDELFLPAFMSPVGADIGGPCLVMRKGSRKMEVVDPGLKVVGWPEVPGTYEVPSGPGKGARLSAFSFTQVIRLKDGNFFATLYGFYQDRVPRLVGAGSTDGIHWNFAGNIAAKGDGRVDSRGEGVTEENAVCQLKDGRLLCVYRSGNNTPYAQAWSRDKGRTWTSPVECHGPHSVEPSLVVLPDGALALSGGRGKSPELKFWINADGTGDDWQEVDIQQFRYAYIRNSDSTSYTGLVALDETHLLYIYDYGWTPPTCGVWAIRMTLKKT